MKLRGLEKLGVRLGLGKSWAKLPVSVLRFILQVVAGLFRTSNGDKFIVLAIPKSGSTFIENCLGHFSNRVSLMHPKINLIEFKKGSSIAILPKIPGMGFYKIGAYYSKYHLVPSQEMVDNLVEAGFKVIVFNRDIDQIRLSHLNYVEYTKHHPMHNKYKGKSLEERVELFDQLEKDKFLKFQEAYDGLKDNERVLKMNYNHLVENEINTINQMLEFVGLKAEMDTDQLSDIKSNKSNLILKHNLK